MTQRKPKASLEFLRQQVSYDPTSGKFVWIVQKVGRSKVGTEAGWKKTSPRKRVVYREIEIGGRCYLAHRLAWLFMTGEWPVDLIDHIDGDGLNNCWKNLREADRFLNGQNRRLPSRNNKTGLLGVSPFQGRFRAHLRINGKYTYLGSYTTPEEAYDVYIQAKRKHHPGCTI